MAQAVNAGYSSEILNVAITDSTWTGVSFSKNPNNILVRMRGTGDVKVCLDNTGTTYLTIPEGMSLTYDWNAGKSTDVFFLQGSVAGTAEIVATFE